MAFSNPALLWGLFAAASPVIIYLLMRSRVKEVEWAALRFLLEIAEERKSNWEEILLIILRTLFLACLAFALVRPLLRSDAGGKSAAVGDSPTLIAIDNSLSMAMSQGTVSRQKKAGQAAADIFSNMDGSKGGALLQGNRKSKYIMREFTLDHDLLAESAGRIETSDLRGSPQDIVQMAAQGLGTLGGDRGTLVLVSDFQSSEWKKISQVAKDELAALARKHRVVFVPVGDGEDRNVAITEFSLPGSRLRKGSQVNFKAVVKNYASQEDVETIVELLVGGTVRQTQTISLKPGESQTLKLPLVLEDSGWMTAELRLRGDTLENDNHAFLAFESGEGEKILAVVNEMGMSQPERSGARFIELALNPFPQGAKDPRAAYVFDYISESAFTGKKLDKYSIVLLCDVSGFMSADGKKLKDYVSLGGGVLSFIGDKSQPQLYNPALYAEGAGIMSWPLAQDAITQKDPKEPINFISKSTSHPIFAGLFSDKENYFSGVDFFKAWGFDTAENKRVVQVLAKASGNGVDKPFIVDFRTGVGHSIFVGSSADLTMNNFALRPVFVAFANQAVNYLLSFGVSQRSLLAGDSLRMPVGFSRSQATYRMKGPDLIEAEYSVLPDGENFILEVPQFDSSGAYDFVNVSDGEDRFGIVVNPDSSESAVECMTANAVKEEFGPLGVEVVEPDKLLEEGGSSGSELAQWLLLLVVLFWLGENLLGYRISSKC